MISAKREGTPDERAAAYRERQQAYQRQYAASASRNANDIGPIPEPVNAERRAACELDFKRFCLTYFAEMFTLGFSADHLKVIEKIERVILSGGLFANAMPRGSGKTTLFKVAALWAILYGHRRFPVLICADAGKAKRMLRSIKTIFETNDSLIEDFPEACIPVRALERKSIRCASQHQDGNPTFIEWGQENVVLASVAEPWASCSGAAILVGGLTGAVRGAQHTTPDGNVIRPDLVLLDDPQTRESAGSASQCDNRERIVSADLLGMAGPGKKISAFMACTVVYENDMADRMLNRESHPEWQGERAKMLYEFPERMDLWDQYAELRRDLLRSEEPLNDANQFVLDNYDEMHRGAVVGWDDRKEDGDVSALQHAMNLYYRDPEAFASEYQNEPVPLVAHDDTMLTVNGFMERQSDYAPGDLSLAVEKVTAMIDVHQDALYWMVVGWESNFTGYITAYGVHPEQNTSYFQLASIRKKMHHLYPGRSFEAYLRKGLDDLIDDLMGRTFKREDDVELSVSRMLVDAHWGDSTPHVCAAIKQNSNKSNIYPSFGSGAEHKPKKKRGRKNGLNWHIEKGNYSLQHVSFDANWWKTFVHARFSTPDAQAGALYLPKVKRKFDHQLVAEHFTAEYRNRITNESTGRSFDQWKVKPGGGDNHWLDCIVGAAIGANIEGIKLAEMPREETKPRKKLTKGRMSMAERLRGKRK